MSQEQIYAFADEPIERLPLSHRILLYMVQQDIEAGRDGNSDGWHGDLRETCFMFSSTFVHFTSALFANVVYWQELKRSRRHGKLPEGYIDTARPGTGIRLSFMLQLRRLIRKGDLSGFTSGFRALKGLGGMNVPLLQLWTEKNRDRPKDIYAVSLTTNGFHQATHLLEAKTQIAPWELHGACVSNKTFGAHLTGHSHSET